MILKAKSLNRHKLRQVKRLMADIVGVLAAKDIRADKTGAVFRRLVFIPLDHQTGKTDCHFPPLHFSAIRKNLFVVIHRGSNYPQFKQAREDPRSFVVAIKGWHKT